MVDAMNSTCRTEGRGTGLRMEEGLLRSSNHLYNKDVDGIWLGFSGERVFYNVQS